MEFFNILEVNPLFKTVNVSMTVCQTRICFKIIYLQLDNSAGSQREQSAKPTLFERAAGMASALESKECGFHGFHSLMKCHGANEFVL